MADKKIHQDYHVCKVTEISSEDGCNSYYEAAGPIGSEECKGNCSKSLSQLAGMVIDDHVKYLARHDMTYKGPEMSPLGNLDLKVFYKTAFDIRVDGDDILEFNNLSPTERRAFAKGLHARNHLYWNSDFDNVEEFVRSLPEP